MTFLTTSKNSKTTNSQPELPKGEGWEQNALGPLGLGEQFKEEISQSNKIINKQWYNTLNNYKKIAARNILNCIFSLFKGYGRQKVSVRFARSRPHLSVLPHGLQNLSAALLATKPENYFQIIVGRPPETAFLNLSGIFVRVPPLKRSFNLRESL